MLVTFLTLVDLVSKWGVGMEEARVQASKAVLGEEKETKSEANKTPRQSWLEWKGKGSAVVQQGERVRTKNRHFCVVRCVPLKALEEPCEGTGDCGQCGPLWNWYFLSAL